MANVTRAVVLPDTHSPLHDEPAVRCAIKSIEIVKPDIVIFLGDLIEAEGASPWKAKKKHRAPLEFQLPLMDEDIAHGNAMLDRLDRACADAGVKRKEFIQGNHDEWLDRVVEDNPFLENTTHEYGKGYLFKDAMSLRGRGWRYHPLGALLKIGHLRFYHGYNAKGIHHARSHLMRFGCNLMYADKHDIQSASVTHVDGQKEAMCIGCLKRLDSAANKWLKGAPHNWGHAFAVVEWVGPNFSATIHRITDGKLPFWGGLIDGNQDS